MIPQIIAELTELNRREAELLAQFQLAIAPLFGSAAGGGGSAGPPAAPAIPQNGALPLQVGKRRRAFKTIPKDLKNLIGKLAHEGKTYIQISAITGVSITSVGRIAPKMKRKHAL